MAERLYYTDSFLKTFEAEVVDIREHARKESGSEWHIALDRSAFYPTSGGQPCDRGQLTATSRSGATLEVEVQNVDEDVSGEVWHVTSKPLNAGTRVTGTIDWARRLDHMQQHSGQHLLSAICFAEAEAATVSFHLGEEIATIDLATDAISEKVLLRIEERVNLAIAEDLPVGIKTVPRNEAETLLASGLLRKLPEREGTIRLIEMPDIDLNACGGTHVASLGQIGSVLLRGTEKTRQGLRLSFVCGLRAVKQAGKDNRLLKELSGKLSVGRDSLEEAIDRKLGEVKAGAKERQHLLEELADYHAARLLVEDPIEHGFRIVERQFTDRDLGYVKLLASRLIAAAPQTIAILASLVAGQPPSASIVFARSKDQSAIHCGEWLSAALAEQGSRGGGSPEMAQGQLQASLLQEVFAKLRARCLTAASAPLS
jgi:alanyl-tRNA synthetase